LICSTEARVALPGPLDVRGSLALFHRHGDDLIDRWDGYRLIRAAPVDGTHLPFIATAGGTLAAPHFDVVPPVAAIQRQVASTFVAPASDLQRLRAQDPIIRTLDARFPGIHQIRQLDLFTALIRCISAQQVNLRWAATTRRRLAEAFGQKHEIQGEIVYSLAPEQLAEVDPARIRALQFTTSKSLAIVAVARRLALDPALSLAELEALPDEDVIARLVSIKGIGRWSAEWVLARTLSRPTVVGGDLGVRKAVGLAYCAGSLPSEPDVRAITAHWGASASAAQALLLYALGEGALGPSRAPAR
jgi:DNA-3-methyladenine glycosylase II